MTLRQFMEAKGLATAGVNKCHCAFHGSDIKKSAFLNPNNIYCFACSRTYTLWDFQQAFGVVLDRDESEGGVMKSGYVKDQVLFEYPFEVREY
jgi:hypothetical protein